MNALGIRVLRIRESLLTCVQTCRSPPAKDLGRAFL